MRICHRQTLPVSRNFCYQSVYCRLIRDFLFKTRIASCFTNSSKRFRCEVGQYSRMNTRCARGYNILAPAQPLRSWREQRPSNHGEIDSSVTGEVGRVYYWRWTCFWFHFCTVVRYCCCCVSDGTPCITKWSHCLDHLETVISLHVK
jgi:hypothetical protein